MAHDSRFVREVCRIIRKKSPAAYGENPVVLVSERFFDEASEDLTERNKLLGLVDLPAGTKYLHVSRALVVPVPWLSDYEFEIRPEMNKAYLV